MIHEVILSLLGQTGDIIILTDKKKKNKPDETNINIDQYCFEVNNNIHIFLNSEIRIINEIVQLGYYFYIINTFCLLVKQNTIYKNLTHVHKFNKLNEERNEETNGGGNRKSSNSHSSSSSSCYSSSSDSSDSCPFYSDYEREKRRGGWLGGRKRDEEKREAPNGIDNTQLKEEGNQSKRSRVDNYFGVLLKNVKSMNGVQPYGYYANGIYNEIQKFVKSYLKKISEIEEYINNNNSTPLTQILTMLEKKREEILIIIDIIKNYLDFQKKEENNVMEGESRCKTKELLDYLYDNCINGNLRIKNVYYRYFKCLGKILLHQINSWILYGQLIDPYYEFFVQKRQFIYTDDRKIFLAPEELYENLFLTNVQSLNFEWNYLFFQSLSNMPKCCIDKGTGRKILFIGKSIRILIRSNRWTTQDVISLFPIIKILSKAFTKREKKNRRKGLGIGRRKRRIITPYDVDYSNEKKDGGIGNNGGEEGAEISSSNIDSDSSSYSVDSTDLEEEETLNLYCKEIFDITIEKIRRIIAYKLWKYIVRDINLIKIFDLYKDIYLLNSGDFYEYFFEKSWSLMHIPPNTKNEILLKIYAWKNASIQVEDYFRLHYENNKKEKLKLDLYEENFFDGTNNSRRDDEEFHFFNESKNNEFNIDTSENIVAKYFYPRIAHKRFFYDSFEKEKLENIILGGMTYVEENTILLNNFYTGIKSLSQKKYYEYDNIFSVCINNYRQQILKGFKHGFDFSLNFNNFFDNRSGNINAAANYRDTSIKEKGFLVGACFALVMHSVKNPLLYKTEVLKSELGYWGNLGDCLSVEIKVKFFEKNGGKRNETEGDLNNVAHEPQLRNPWNENVSNSVQLNKPLLGDVEVEVSLYIGGKGISSFVHNNNNFSSDFTKESLLYRKLLEEKSHHKEYSENEEGFLGKTKRGAKKTMRNKNVSFNDDERNSNEDRKNRTPVLKIQSNKQMFSNIDKNSITKFRVRINCLKHSFSVYLQKMDEYNIIANAGRKNKIRPIIYVRALDMTQAFSLDIGSAYIGFYTCPILFKHKLLKQKKKLEEWFQKFYNETLHPASNIYKKKKFHIESETDKQIIQNELDKINRIILCSNTGKGANFEQWKNENREKIENLLMFSNYDCCVQIHRWYHQSYKSPIEMPEVNADNEILIFYDKQVKKNVRIHSGLNNWNNIEIHFKLTWPIALIINTNTIYTYNAIFQFRFLLGRIYYNLKILCYHNRQLIKYLSSPKGIYLFSHLFSIRYKMQFFFFQLIRYLQEDIINHEYKLMTNQIHKSQDFEYTKSVHDLYIAQIATKCFLSVHELTTPLIELIDICFKFCYFFQCLIENELFVDILNSEQNDANMNNNTYANEMNDDDDDLRQVVEKLMQYNDTFDEKFTLVLNEMTNLSLNTNQTHLVHLLTILDYNNYATKIKENVRRKKEQQIELYQQEKKEEREEEKKTDGQLNAAKKRKARQNGYEYGDNDDDVDNVDGEKDNDIGSPSDKNMNTKYMDPLHKWNQRNITNNQEIPYEIKKTPYYSKNVLLNETNFSTKSVTYNTRNVFDVDAKILNKRVVNNFGNFIHSSINPNLNNINNNNIINNNYISNNSVFPNENESMYGLNSTMMQKNVNEISLNNVSAPIFDHVDNTSVRFGMESSITKPNLVDNNILRNREMGLVGKELIDSRRNDMSKWGYVDTHVNNKYGNIMNNYKNKKWMNRNEQSINDLHNNNNNQHIINGSNYNINNVTSIKNSNSDFDIGSLSSLNFTTDSDLFEKSNISSSKLPPNIYNNDIKDKTSNYQQHPIGLDLKQKFNYDDNLFNKFDFPNNYNINNNTIRNDNINRNNILKENGVVNNIDLNVQEKSADTNMEKYNYISRNNVNSKIRSDSVSTIDLKVKNNFNIQDLLDKYNYEYDNNIKNKYSDSKTERDK